MTATPYPHIWVWVSGFSKMWIRLKTATPVDKSVGKLSEFFPQVDSTHLSRASPTSRLSRIPISHLFGSFAFIHTIHTPYYDYD